jgi:ketosteroid isomerase-like protein
MSSDSGHASEGRSGADRTIIPTGNQDLELLRGAWAAFAAGDLEAASAALDPQVRWYAADEPDADGTCHNRGDALAFLRRARADGVSAELLELRDVGDHIVSIIQTHVPRDWGEQPPPHGEVVTVRDGKIVEMVVYPTADEALQAALAPD